ncbi:hypothetical protein DM02DRAFT_214213 [Periconia macrospinosa]|uniref:Uncharacterized protein n=1 Tax=Periconia macrospinosa TaxID=97972 RepID=A0A2V1E0K8_9PLEO|nr:hypothetical protein DM02DRAFT_214213 [Periconia macrospinosa]
MLRRSRPVFLSQRGCPIRILAGEAVSIACILRWPVGRFILCSTFFQVARRLAASDLSIAISSQLASVATSGDDTLCRVRGSRGNGTERGEGKQHSKQQEIREGGEVDAGGGPKGTDCTDGFADLNGEGGGGRAPIV